MSRFAFTLLAALLWSGQASASEPPWAGVPLAQLSALGLGEPSLDLVTSRWSAATGGGFVRMTVLETDADAAAAFAGEAATAATVALPPVEVLGADVAVGDPSSMLVLRSRNVVLVVRDVDGGALEVAGRLLSALQTDGEPAVHATRTLDGRTLRWDGFGRLMKD